MLYGFLFAVEYWIVLGVGHWFQSHWFGLQEQLFVTVVLSIPLSYVVNVQRKQLREIEKNRARVKLFFDRANRCPSSGMRERIDWWEREYDEIMKIWNERRLDRSNDFSPTDQSTG
jgi:hypothetical protein